MLGSRSHRALVVRLNLNDEGLKMIPMDWVFGLIGGLLIGLAGAVYLLGNGRVMGASGIIGGLVDRSAGGTWLERLAFLSYVVQRC